MSRNNTDIRTPVLIAILGALILGVFLFAPGGLNTLEGGVTVVSVDEPNLVGNEDLTSLNWIVQTRLIGSDRIKFSLSPSEMKSESGVASERTFTATADNLREYIVYDIQQNYDQALYQYALAGPFNEASDCPSNTALTQTTIFSVERRTWWLGITTEYHCLQKQLIGRTGDYKLRSTQFDADLIISNGEETFTQPISSSGGADASATFTTNDGTIGRAVWTGSLTTGNAPDNLNEYTAVLKEGGSNVWQPVIDTNVDKYVQIYNNLESWIDTNIPTYSTQYFGSDWDVIEPQLKSRISNLNSEKRSTIDSVRSPEVVWYIRADWLGVERVAGEPRIDRIPDVTFGSSGTAYVPIAVTNVGNGRGTFTATLDSCTGVTVTRVPTRITLEPQQSGTISFSIDNGAANEALDETCRVRVYDVNLQENSDTGTFGVVYSPDLQCDPDAYFARGAENQIRKCASDGLSSALVEQCASDEIVTSTNEGPYGGFECASDSDPDVIIDPPVEKRFSMPLFIVTLLIAGGGAVYAYATTRFAFKKMGVRTPWISVGLAAGIFVVLFLGIPAFVNSIIGLFTIGGVGFTVIP